MEGPTSHALSFSAGAALNALELASKTIDEGVRTTLFFRVLVNSEAEAESLTLNLGFTDKPIRFVGDFDNDVGPFVQFSNHEVQGSKLFDLYAIDGVGETPVWLNNPDLDLDTHYNVWLDIDNRSVEDGDLFSIHIKEDGAGGDRVTVAEEWLSDRNPAGSTDLGAVFPELDVLFTVAFAGSESDGLVLFDDFYLSTTGSFNDSVPVPVQETAFMDEVDPPDPTGDAEIRLGLPLRRRDHPGVHRHPLCERCGDRSLDRRAGRGLALHLGRLRRGALLPGPLASGSRGTGRSRSGPPGGCAAAARPERSIGRSDRWRIPGPSGGVRRARRFFLRPA